MSDAPLRVGIVGCGLIGRKRAEALGRRTSSSAAPTSSRRRPQRLAADFGGRACDDLDELLALEPDVVVVATTHDQLAPLAEQALEAGAHVLVEKPAGLGTAQVDATDARRRAQPRRLVKVGFNHRFHPALARAAAEVHSGAHGELHARARRATATAAASATTASGAPTRRARAAAS